LGRPAEAIQIRSNPPHFGTEHLAFRDLINLPTDRLVAFAGSRLEPLPVHNLDLPTMVANETGLLQHIGDDRDSGAAHAEHLRQEFVGKLDGVAVKAVAGLQQPATQTRLDRMQGVAGSGLLDLTEQHLALADTDLADGVAVLDCLAKMRGRNARGGSRHLDDRARMRTALPESGE
jgi:hypothetical protein